MNRTYDTIVVGLGAMGSATLYHLAHRGKKVLGLDRFKPPHEKGSSHGESRGIRQAYYEGEIYIPLIMRSYDLWRDLERRSGKNLLQITGGLTVGLPDSPAITGIKKSAEAFQLPYELLEASEVRKKFPPLSPPDEYIGAFEKTAGVLFPEKSIIAHLSLAEANGALTHFNEPVQDWTIGGTGTLTVRTPANTYQTRRMILTTGAWTTKLLDLEHCPIQPHRAVMHWFQPKTEISRFQPGCFPVHFWQLKDGTEFYGLPALGYQGDGVKVAFHNRLKSCDPDTLNPQVDEAEIRRMSDHLKFYIPELAGRWLRSTPCMYTLSPDSHFIIGRHPEFATVIVGAGFSGHGFKFAPVIGEILTQLTLNEESVFNLDPFSLQRFGFKHAQ